MTIEGEQGRGWTTTRIFDGFEHRKETRQDRREEGNVVHDAPIEGAAAD